MRLRPLSCNPREAAVVGRNYSTMTAIVRMPKRYACTVQLFTLTVGCDSSTCHLYYHSDCINPRGNVSILHLIYPNKTERSAIVHIYDEMRLVKILNEILLQRPISKSLYSYRGSSRSQCVEGQRECKLYRDVHTTNPFALFLSLQKEEGKARTS